MKWTKLIKVRSIVGITKEEEGKRKIGMSIEVAYYYYSTILIKRMKD